MARALAAKICTVALVASDGGSSVSHPGAAKILD